MSCRVDKEIRTVVGDAEARVGLAGESEVGPVQRRYCKTAPRYAGAVVTARPAPSATEKLDGTSSGP